MGYAAKLGGKSSGGELIEGLECVLWDGVVQPDWDDPSLTGKQYMSYTTTNCYGHSALISTESGYRAYFWINLNTSEYEAFFASMNVYNNSGVGARIYRDSFAGSNHIEDMPGAGYNSLVNETGTHKYLICLSGSNLRLFCVFVRRKI